MRGCIALSVLVAACGPDTANGEGGIATDSVGDSTGDGDDDGDDAATWAPDACDLEVSPFLSADCLDALRISCRSQASAEACEARPPLSFDGGGFPVHCGWAKVVRFADADACAVESVEGRCEAGLAQSLIGCGDPCTLPEIHSALSAFTAEAELVEMPCAPGGSSLGGPLGRSSAVGAPPDERDSGSCLDNISPPAPPLCDCAAAACEAR